MDIDVKEIRKKLGITQQELAYQLGVGVITVSRWERGSAKPSRLARKELARLVAKGGKQ